MKAILCLTLLMASVKGFKLNPSKSFQFKLQDTTWQEDLDNILDVDTSCSSRRSEVRSFFSKAREVSKDLRSAIRERDIEKIAPTTRKYGKALKGLQQFRKQLVSDIIPGVFTKAIPSIVEEAPKIVSSILEDGPSRVVERGQESVNRARDMATNPSKTFADVRSNIQSAPGRIRTTASDLRRELKNVLKSTPEGLEQPSYVVVKTEEDYEIRMYSPYSIASTDIAQSDYDIMEEIRMDPVATTGGFNRLLRYTLGANSKSDGMGFMESEKLAMTVPVIIRSNTMNFVLPNKYNSTTAPFPENLKVVVDDVPGELVAVRAFSGLATETEISKQRAKLEDSLIFAGILYESSSFRVLQYNPPYTLPWIRRNEVGFKITMSEDSFPSSRPNASVKESTAGAVNTVASGVKDNFAATDASKYFSAPEAGD